MSCGVPCPCQLSCMTDNQGSKRDPVNSEKAWLDFAVRCLSREAVCKGKGQEAVWSSKCKPSWWDSVVSLPWKNPTANPKDTKEVLMKKYDALKQHLEADGRFPQELEEEAMLWADGKYKELFLLTSLSSLKGKVTGLHVSVIETCTKAAEMKAEVNQGLIDEIKSCVSATLKSIENLTTKSKEKTLKRPFTKTGKENVKSTRKKCKLVNEVNRNPKQLPVSRVVPILPKENKPTTVGISVPDQSDQSKLILAQLQKVLIKRKGPIQKPNVGHSTSPNNLLPHRPERSASESCNTNHSPTAQSVHNTFLSYTYIDSQNMSPDHVLSDTRKDDFLSRSALGLEEDHFDFESENTPIVPESAIISIPSSEANVSMSSCYESTFSDKNSENSPHHGSYFQNSEFCNIDFLDPKEHSWTDVGISNFVENNATESLEIPENSSSFNKGLYHINQVSSTSNSRVQSGRSSSAESSHERDNSDSGCMSDASVVDSILSPEEQNRIWSDDDIEIDASLDLWDFVNDC